MTKLSIPSWMRIHMSSVAVSLTNFATGLLHGILMFYYVKVFKDKYHISNAWFSAVQVAFMIWNAINDPIFGYIQDFGCCGISWIRNRKKVILYCAPLFALSFMLFWIPWYPLGAPSVSAANSTNNLSWNITSEPAPVVAEWLVGLHLLVSLFLYDTMFSLALSAHCGLFTEVATDAVGRVRIVKYMTAASLLATFVIFPVDILSKSLQDFQTFQIVCGVVAVVAMVCFIYTGIMSPDPHDAYKANEEAQTEEEAQHIKNETWFQGLKRRLKATIEIITNIDFISVTMGNFMHILRMTGTTNFTTIYTEAIISSWTLPLGSWNISTFYTACNTVPKVVLLMVSPLLVKFGAWTCLFVSLALTVLNSLICFGVGMNDVMFLIFVLIDSVLGDAFWQMYNIMFPDIAHDDFQKKNRKNPLTTLIFTLNALFTKPAISLAPIIISNILNHANYDQYKDESQRAQMGVEQIDGLKRTMFQTAVFYPLICALLEMILLMPYRMKIQDGQLNCWKHCAECIKKTISGVNRRGREKTVPQGEN